MSVSPIEVVCPRLVYRTVNVSTTFRKVIDIGFASLDWQAEGCRHGVFSPGCSRQPRLGLIRLQGGVNDALHIRRHEVALFARSGGNQW